MLVVKRNGQKQPFDIRKISNALIKANTSVAKKYQLSKTKLDTIAENVETTIFTSNRKSINVEKIQDLVEEELIKIDAYALARHYIRYRHLHELERDNYKEFMQTISNKLEAKEVQNQNANVDEKSFGGRIGEATSVMTRKFALDYCMSDMARENHLNNEIYIHDLDNYAVGNHNCLSIPFDELLEKGFNTRQTDVRPAQSVSTAMQLVAVIFQLQSLQQFGGVAATHLDWTMVPYVRKSFGKYYKEGLKYLEDIDESDIDYEIDNMLRASREYSIEDSEYKAYSLRAYQYALDMTRKEVYQSVEGLYHNLNTLQSRSGNQLPFTSINYGTCISPEGRMIIKALLEVSIDGLGKLHKTSIFPCGIFQCMKGVNRAPGDPNYDLFKLALKSTS